MTQKEQVIKYFEKNNNKQKHFKTIANELNILVPNMRRILGEGTLKGIFTRVDKGIYKLNNEDNQKTIKEDWEDLLVEVLSNYDNDGICEQIDNICNDLNKAYKTNKFNNLNK